MEAIAHVKHVRITPRKVKIVAALIRGKDIGEARSILMHTPKSACEPMLKLLKSAVSNAENNFQMDTDQLMVSQVFCTPGPTLKRIRPAAKGRAKRILKRTSHITLAVKEREGQEAAG